jgi:hypothetical protein
MEGENNLNKVILEGLKAEATRYRENKEQEILQACKSVILRFKNLFGIGITNFQYLRMREVANEVVDQIIDEFEKRAMESHIET